MIAIMINDRDQMGVKNGMMEARQKIEEKKAQDDLKADKTVSD